MKDTHDNNATEGVVSLTPDELTRLKNKFSEISKKGQAAWVIEWTNRRMPTITHHFSQEDNKDIYLAMHSGDEQLIEDTLVSVFFYLRARYYKTATKYLTSNSNMISVEEYVGGDLYTMIKKELPRYNGNFELNTFFTPYINQLFMQLRSSEDGVTTDSTYFAVIKNFITRAERELLGQGATNITNIEISRYIKMRFNRDISVGTIERIKARTAKLESTDISGQQIADKMAQNPEEKMIEKENREEFHKAVKRIKSEPCRMYLLAELQYMASHAEIPGPKDTWEICKTFMPDITKQEAISIKRAAHAAIKQTYRAKQLREELPINHIRRKNEDIQWTQDTDDIAQAFNNGEILFEDEEYEAETQDFQDVTEAFFDDED